MRVTSPSRPICPAVRHSVRHRNRRSMRCRTPCFRGWKLARIWGDHYRAPHQATTSGGLTVASFARASKPLTVRIGRLLWKRVLLVTALMLPLHVDAACTFGSLKGSCVAMFAGEFTGILQRCNLKLDGNGRATGSCLDGTGAVFQADPVQFSTTGNCRLSGRSDNGFNNNPPAKPVAFRRWPPKGA